VIEIINETFTMHKKAATTYTDTRIVISSEDAECQIPQNVDIRRKMVVFVSHCRIRYGSARVGGSPYNLMVMLEQLPETRKCQKRTQMEHAQCWNLSSVTRKLVASLDCNHNSIPPHHCKHQHHLTRNRSKRMKVNVNVQRAINDDRILRTGLKSDVATYMVQAQHHPLKVSRKLQKLKETPQQ